MITKLLPEDVSKHWGILKHGVEMSVPPTAYGGDVVNNILANILAGGMECWISHETIGEELHQVTGMMVTTFVEDLCSGNRDLMIYCMYSYGDRSIGGADWVNGFDMLARYARSRKCNRIVAYTNVPYMLKMAEMFGGDSDYTYVTFDVNSD